MDIVRHDLLPAHTVSRSDGKRLKGIFVVFQESGVKSRVGFREEAFWMEDTGLNPAFRGVLDVLEVDAMTF